LTAKAKLAKASPSKQTIAKAKQRSQATSVAQQRRGGDWEAARGQILLRPALPAGTYGYQPYYPSGYGWR
jgi:hypothetical protein